MSIENKIEELTTSINNLASILGGATKGVNYTSTPDAIPTKTAKKVKEVEETVSEEVESEETKPVKKAKKTKEVSEDTSSDISADDLISLAKTKIAEGHDRAAIKNKITELGAAQITALSQESLVKFKTFLDNLNLEQDL